MKKETYGNPFRAGEKNIDDLYKSMIRYLHEKDTKNKKFEYIFGDVCKIMSELDWKASDKITVEVVENSDKEKIITIKNMDPKEKSLPQNNQEPVVV